MVMFACTVVWPCYATGKSLMRYPFVVKHLYASHARCVAFDLTSPHEVGISTSFLCHHASWSLEQLLHHLPHVLGRASPMENADSYRGHLFTLLWRGCSIVESSKPTPSPAQCCERWWMALELLAQGGHGWSVVVFVEHAHRAVASIERLAGGDAAGEGIKEAKKLGTLCHGVVCSREGESWPTNHAVAGSDSLRFHHTWADWLQLLAGLHEKEGNGNDGQRLLQVAYDYVRYCFKHFDGHQRGQLQAGKAVCAAYAAMLKMQAAASISEACTTDVLQQHTVCTPRKEKRGANKRAGRRNLSKPSPASAFHTHTSSALDYLDIVHESLQAVVSAAGGRQEDAGNEAADIVLETAAAKAWKWARKSCGAAGRWLEEIASAGKENSCDCGRDDFEKLHARSLRSLGELSRLLAQEERQVGLGVRARLPPRHRLAEIAAESFLREVSRLVSTLVSSPSAAAPSTSKKEEEPSAAGSTEGRAKQALAAAGQICNEHQHALLHLMPRVSAGWFSLGRISYGTAQRSACIEAFVNGCCQLEQWAELARHVPASKGSQDDSLKLKPSPAAQLDVHLSMLSEVLQEQGESALAALAALRAVASCTELLSVRCDTPVRAAVAAYALVEKHVACEMRAGATPASQRRTTSSSTCSEALRAATRYLGADERGLFAAAAGRQDDQSNVVAYLRARDVPLTSIVWVLMGKCEAYGSSALSSLSGADNDISMRMQGVRIATATALQVCRESSTGDHSRSLRATWEVPIRVQAARWEIMLFLSQAQASSGSCTSSVLIVDLNMGLDHVEKAAEVLRTLPDETALRVPAMQSVCACLRAMLLRCIDGRQSEVAEAMKSGLDVLWEAATKAGLSMGDTFPAGAMRVDSTSVLSLLTALKDHFALHGDTTRRVRSVKLRALVSNGPTSGEREWDALGTSAQTAVLVAATLSEVGMVHHAAGVSMIPSLFNALACEHLRKGRHASERQHEELLHSAGSDSAVYAVASVSVASLRGLCLADGDSESDEAEHVILAAAQTGRDISARSHGVTAAGAARVECGARLSLAWLQERRGRFAAAVSELRRVLRLCHEWASTSGSSMNTLDRQLVLLSAARGTSIHDGESVGGGEMGEKQSRHEGIRDGTRGVEEEMNAVVSHAEQYKAGECAVLNSAWLPIYMSALAGLGRLWAARGFGPKSSGYLRRGCVVSEPLHAAPFLRACLQNRVTLAASMRDFDRSDRLLRSCQALLDEEVAAHAATSATSRCSMRGQLASEIEQSSQGKYRSMARKGGRSQNVPESSKQTTSEIHCSGCLELAMHAGELRAREADLRRRQGDFDAAIDACEHGWAAIAPALEPASGAANITSSASPLSLALDEEAIGGQQTSAGWRAIEVSAALHLQQGRAAYVLGDIAVAEEHLDRCVQSSTAGAIVRAQALYRLGRIRLDRGDTAAASHLLSHAEFLCRETGAPKTVRRIRRALAVAGCAYREADSGRQCQEYVAVKGSWSVAALSCLSVGTTLCNQVLHGRSNVDDRCPVAGADDTSLGAGMELFEVVGGSVEAGGGAKREGQKSGAWTPGV